MLRRPVIKQHLVEAESMKAGVSDRLDIMSFEFTPIHKTYVRSRTDNLRTTVYTSAYLFSCARLPLSQTLKIF
jgi:hypothetical protein